jgi:predicted NUDIX family NTP pyrophosphohydrolase
MKKQSAGLLVYRLRDSQPEVLIAHMGGPFHAKKDAGHWSIPKGEYDDGEDPLATAQREFKEELGQEPPEGKFVELDTIKQKNNKTVIVWAVEGDLDVSDIKSNTFEMEWPPKSGRMQEFPEIDKAEWYSLTQAAQKLIPAQAEFLKRLAGKLEVTFEASEPSAQSQQGSLF